MQSSISHLNFSQSISNRGCLYSHGCSFKVANSSFSLPKNFFRNKKSVRRIGITSYEVSNSQKNVELSDSTTLWKNMGKNLRNEFPILDQEVHEQPLIYFDNAATSQKPLAVLNKLEEYYKGYNSNVHRGVHSLSARATTEYEEARQKVASFVNASTWKEVVFTRNASEALNLVAYTWGMQNLKPGDEIVLSVLEHHSNLVPWQIVAQKTGAVLKHVGLTEDERIDMEHLRTLVGPRTKLVSLAHISNTLGCVLPVDEVSELAHSHGALLLLDACQSVPHMKIDVQSLGADFIVASGHKMCAPTGIGFLWGRYDLLETLDPWMGGGEMIQDVFLDHSTYADPPARFEAGTPAIGEAIGLGAACDFLTSLGMDNVHHYEQQIGDYLYQELAKVEGVRIFGPKPDAPGGRAALCSFHVDGIHATDLSMILDQKGIAIRSGHHCTQPLHHYLGVNASARASLYIYNSKDEVDAFISNLIEVIEFFKDIEGFE